MKKKLIFVPSYIASLRYFEQLIPHLKNNYDVGFLFISTLFIPRGKKRFLSEMINYCKEKNYEYFIIEDYQKKGLEFLPFYHAIKLYYDHKKKYQNFLTSNGVATLITPFQRGFFYDCLTGVTNKLSVKTLMLSWLITNPYHQIVVKEFNQRAGKPKRKRMASFIKRRIYYRLLEKFTNLLSHGGAKKFAVINQYAYNILKKSGVPEKKISIVGYANFDIAKKTLDLLNNDLLLKEETAEKYNIDLNKKNIIIYSSPFYRNDFISPEELVEYYCEIVKTIKEVFTEKEADILFKLHPSEKDLNLYEPLKKLGVKIYDKNTNNEELISFADLYIAHWSTANFVPLIMQKDCIFINLMKFKFVDLFKEMFSIKKFISDMNEFKSLLIDFKNGKLVKQYNNNSIMNDGKCIARIIEWID
ncbi:MAG: hypothetical protein ABH805_02165 [Candidatus Nealsonbacteria bacterium]